MILSFYFKGKDNNTRDDDNDCLRMTNDDDNDCLRMTNDDDNHCLRTTNDDDDKTPNFL